MLLLEQGKYYVGKSDNVEKRFQRHVNGTGALWTRKYKPLHIEKIIETTSLFEEDKITKEYMARYGIHNVRGGSYVTEYLNGGQLEALKHEIWSAQNRCTRCGRKGHYINGCYARTDVDGYPLDTESDYESDDSYSDSDLDIELYVA